MRLLQANGASRSGSAMQGRSTIGAYWLGECPFFESQICMAYRQWKMPESCAYIDQQIGSGLAQG